MDCTEGTELPPSFLPNGSAGTSRLSQVLETQQHSRSPLQPPTRGADLQLRTALAKCAGEAAGASVPAALSMRFVGLLSPSRLGCKEDIPRRSQVAGFSSISESCK